MAAVSAWQMLYLHLLQISVGSRVRYEIHFSHMGEQWGSFNIARAAAAGPRVNDIYVITRYNGGVPRDSHGQAGYIKSLLPWKHKAGMFVS